MLKRAFIWFESIHSFRSWYLLVSWCMRPSHQCSVICTSMLATMQHMCSATMSICTVRFCWLCIRGKCLLSYHVSMIASNKHHWLRFTTHNTDQFPLLLSYSSSTGNGISASWALQSMVQFDAVLFFGHTVWDSVPGEFVRWAVTA